MRTYSKPFRRQVHGKPSRYYYCKIREDGMVSRRSTGAETLGKARKVVAAWMRDDIAAGPVSAKTLLAVVDLWLRAKRPRMSEGYHQVYTSYRNQWKDHFGATRLRDISVESVDRYLRLRLARRRSARTVNDERAALRMFFTWCQDAGYSAQNPAKLVPKFPERKRRIATLAPDQEQRLLRAAESAGERVYSLILCLVHTGLRRGTVERLAWLDVDFDRQEWTIPAEKVKSREDYVGRPISDELFSWLKEHRPAGPRDRKALIFGQLQAETWRRITEAADLEWLRPHDLRRHFVTRCRRAGVSLEVCMYLSDHRDLRTVLECYRAVETEEARQALTQAFQKPE